MAAKGGSIFINGFNISSPLLKGAITGTAGGAVGGYSGGFTSGLLMTGDFGKAHEFGVQGLYTGASLGLTSGTISAYAYSKQNGFNPFTGKANNSITIGEGMANRVNPIAKDLNSRTITKPWRDKFGNVRVNQELGLGFNEAWFKAQLRNDAKVYNAGPNGSNSPYYNLELNIIKTTNHQNIQNVHMYQFNYNNMSLRFTFVK